MRKLILILLVGVVGNAQMKVKDVETHELIGEYKHQGVVYAKIENVDGLARFTYRDQGYASIDVYNKFYLGMEDLDTLHSLFYDMSDKSEGDKMVAEMMSGDRLIFTYKKVMGKLYASVVHDGRDGVTRGLTDITRKKINKLFGK